MDHTNIICGALFKFGRKTRGVRAARSCCYKLRGGNPNVSPRIALTLYPSHQAVVCELSLARAHQLVEGAFQITACLLFTYCSCLCHA